MKDLYAENYKTLMNETEDDTNKWKDILHSQIGRINSKNVHILQSNLQIQFNPYQNFNVIIHRNGTNNPKICMETQKVPNSQSNLEKEVQSCRYHMS